MALRSLWANFSRCICIHYHQVQVCLAYFCSFTCWSKFIEVFTSHLYFATVPSKSTALLENVKETSNLPIPDHVSLDTVCSQLVQGSFLRKGKGKCILNSLSQADDKDIVPLELCLFVLETSAVDLQLPAWKGTIENMQNMTPFQERWFSHVWKHRRQNDLRSPYTENQLPLTLERVYCLNQTDTTEGRATFQSTEPTMAEGRRRSQGTANTVQAVQPLQMQA